MERRNLITGFLSALIGVLFSARRAKAEERVLKIQRTYKPDMSNADSGVYDPERTFFGYGETYNGNVASLPESATFKVYTTKEIDDELAKVSTKFAEALGSVNL